MDKEGILRLAQLARIEIKEHDAEKLSGEFENILNYVGEVKAAAAKSKRSEKKNAKDFIPKNVLRPDEEAHEGGIYTEAVLEQAPVREKNYIKVKKIL